ncbi:MAG: hypothetical protein AAFR93_01420 [Pseudomonadota bacterium]
MHRRLTALLVLFSLAFLPSTALAQTGEKPLAQVVRQLEAQGYEITSTQRTLLGRVRVVSVRGDREREVVFNPRNGNVLRDYVRVLSDDGDTVRGAAERAGSAGSGRNGDEDDEDQEADSDEGGNDDDNEGGGGGEDGGGDEGDDGDDADSDSDDDDNDDDNDDDDDDDD